MQPLRVAGSMGIRQEGPSLPKVIDLPRVGPAPLTQCYDYDGRSVLLLCMTVLRSLENSDP